MPPSEAEHWESSILDDVPAARAVLTEVLEQPLMPEESDRGERAQDEFWHRLDAVGVTEDDLMAQL